MGRRTKRSKNASAVMAAQFAAGIAPWTRMAGFIANRFMTQHGADAAASQQREQQLQAQIEELQQQNASQRLTAYAAAEEIADLQAGLAAAHTLNIEQQQQLEEQQQQLEEQQQQLMGQQQ
ncbi:hypothetical protein QJQ45_000596 [Haematococcus lacustris]|nr:hypothetical protein QJQ45_000596 [Haematococcus lacustris]